MANIKKKRNKKGKLYYEIEVFVGRDINGKKVRKYADFTPKAAEGTKKAEKELNDFVVKFEERVLQGTYYDGNKITYQDYAKKFWKSGYAEKNLTLSQQAQYWDDLNKYIFPEIGMIPITKIGPQNVQAVVDKMQKATSRRNKPLSVNTIKRRFVVMKSVFNYAFRMKIIGENPCDRCVLPKQNHKNKIHTFTVEEAVCFFEYLQTTHDVYYPERKRTRRNGIPYTVAAYTRHVSFPLWVQCYFFMALYGGLRRGEQLALKWSDINYQEQTISVNKSAKPLKKDGKNTIIIGNPKTDSGNRTISLPAICFDYLHQLYEEDKNLCKTTGIDWKGQPLTDFDDNFIFIKKNKNHVGEIMDLCTPNREFKKIIELYNNDPNNKEKLPRLHLHDTRHTSASLLLSEGCDIETVKARLGHAKASTTLDFYGHALDKIDRKASETLEKVLRTAKEQKEEKKSQIIPAMLTAEEQEMLKAYRSATKEERQDFRNSLEDIKSDIPDSSRFS